MPRTRYATNVDRIHQNVTITAAGCWQWSGALTEKGYARLNIAGKTYRAHRVSYESFVGPIPDGLTIDHTCRNRACCNPAHLEAVTQLENVHRSPDTIPALNAAKTECRHGHAYDEANTYRTAKGQRVCRKCRNAAISRLRAASQLTSAVSA